MEYVSIFDMFKIGVGPSSSHTLGPWRASQKFLEEIAVFDLSRPNMRISVTLHGSLSLTGKGHATDYAVILGLAGYDPVTIDTSQMLAYIENIKTNTYISFNDVSIYFDPAIDIMFDEEFLPFHPNGIVFNLLCGENVVHTSTFYSIGGGFIIKDSGETNDTIHNKVYPFPITNADTLLSLSQKYKISIPELVKSNERIDRTDEQIKKDLINIWHVMFESLYIGCHTKGHLPGILHVRRRAAEVNERLLGQESVASKEDWLTLLRQKNYGFTDIMKFVSCFGIAVNEVNAAFGRVVTSPTNGSAGVIPAVILYYLAFVNKESTDDDIIDFLCVSGEIGSIFKKNSTISAAMGGCQAEIGVSSAMAAAGLTYLMGGSTNQCIIAAEIAMEHHLGLTCDPIGGLVQIPCIERNAMGAIKAINAAMIAVDRDPLDVKVSLDKVIDTMWRTAKDMDRKYKETSEGGLATTVNLADC